MRGLIALLFTIGVLYKLKTKKSMELTANDKKNAFLEIARMYGKENAKKLEKLVRWETAHFTSNGFKKTLSAGMEATKTKFPYGWTSLSSYWKLQPDAAPLNEFAKMTDSGNRTVNFLVFKSFLGALKTIAKVLDNRNWDIGSWYSNEPAKQLAYAEKVSKITNKYIV